MPLFTLQRDLDTRPFTFCDRAAQSDDQRFDGRENNRRRSWPGEDGLKRLSVLGVQGQMLAVIAIKCKHKVIAPWIEIPIGEKRRAARKDRTCLGGPCPRGQARTEGGGRGQVVASSLGVASVRLKRSTMLYVIDEIRAKIGGGLFEFSNTLLTKVFYVALASKSCVRQLTVAKSSKLSQ